MAVSHVFSNAIADAAGTITVWNGATTSSVAASDIVKPSAWNSAHNQFLTITGNTSNSSVLSGTNIVFEAGDLVTIHGSSFGDAGTARFNAGHSGQTFWCNMGQIQTKDNISNVTALSKRPIFFQMKLDNPVTFNKMAVDLSRAVSNISNLFTVLGAIYTFVNSTLWSRLASCNAQYSNTQTASISGLRRLEIEGFETVGTTLSPGDYMGMIWFSAAATASMNYSLRGAQISNDPDGIIGTGTNAVTTATSALSSIPYLNQYNGLYTVTTDGPPGSVALADLSRFSAGIVPAVYLYSR